MAAVPTTPPMIHLPPAGLPLTAFEEHMLIDDRASHPMVIVARFDFQGEPPIARLEAALADVLWREPLLRARVERRPGRRPRWVPGPTPVLRQTGGGQTGVGSSGVGQASGAAIRMSLPRLDPWSGPVFHAEVMSHAAGWSLVVAVHHAVCDGLGLSGFIERWFLAVENKPPRRRWSDAELTAALAGRGRVAATWRGFLTLLPRLRPGLAGVRQYVSRRVASLRETGRDPAASPTPEMACVPEMAWCPTILTTTLEPAVEEAVERHAREAGVRVNDVLAAAFIAAVGSQLDRKPETAPQGDRWIRLGVPMSLRTKSDHALPAANRVSMVFLDRRPADRHEFQRLMRSVHDELELIRSHDLGHIFPLSLAASRWLPGGLERTTESPEPQATAVLSNLGTCFWRSPLVDAEGVVHVGGSRLEGWWMVPPVRLGTAVAAATHETSGRRTLAVSVDETVVTAAEAQPLVDAFLEVLRGRAGGSEAPVTCREGMVAS
jgi:hypothetical protein